MDKIAQLSNIERLNLFIDVSEALNIPIAMVEKDFWSCWILYKLFSDKEMSEILRFKGGTSLSKAYHLIERFSEDLDLILTKELILKNSEDIFQPSNKKQKLFTEQISERTAKYISTILKNKISSLLGNTVEVFTDDEYARFNHQYTPEEIDNKNLHIVYPKTASDVYLRPDILLEIGIMSAWIPNEQREILPYIADVYPKLDIKPAIIHTIKAERTFWDKATILHREFFRPENTNTPIRYSRHYYDLYKMAISTIKNTALPDLELLADVVYRKNKLYRCAWARYDLAKPGTLRLLPNNNNRDLLKKDYSAMQGMIFGDIPEWETILEHLKELENEINNS
ncbi:MAG: nucleotidyl transferase AbiEii/AbiGii toxin family protein [Treponema sp.]|nr:nucleotidyl transferase AbiEii/AbiGii toxin family protein [Treponema sp.]